MIARLAVLALVVLPFTILGLPIQAALVSLGLPGRAVLPRIFFRLLAFALGLRIARHGVPLVGRSVLLVTNHISWLDIVAIAASANVTFVAKSEVGRWPVIGVFAWLARTIFVDRTRRTDAGRTRTAMAERLGEGGAVVLFAEGTSDTGARVLPFRSALLGAVRSAIGQKDVRTVPIQPLAIGYTALDGLPIGHAERARIAWIGDMGIGDNLAAILSAGRTDVTLVFAEPLPDGLDRKAAARAAEQAVRARLVAINRARPIPEEAFASTAPKV